MGRGQQGGGQIKGTGETHTSQGVLFLKHLLMCLLMTCLVSAVMVYDTSDEFLTMPLLKHTPMARPQRMKRLFPLSRHFRSRYEIQQVQLEQTGLPQSALVQSYCTKTKQHQLWYLLPFSVSPPPSLLFQSPSPFNWASNRTLKLLAIGHEDHKVSIYEKTSMKRGTLGSWHHRQSFRVEQWNRLDRDESTPLRISMSSNSDVIFVANSHVIYGLFRLPSNGKDQPCRYMMQKLMMDHVQAEFQTFPRSLGSGFLVTSSPFYRQTDGVVHVYRIAPSWEGPVVPLHQTLRCPVRGSFFGGYCSFAHKSMLLVSSPFAPSSSGGSYGSGCVYVYEKTGGNHGKIEDQFRLRQTLTCPEKLPPSQLHTLNFGQVFDVSEDGNWLVVSSHSHGQGRVYVFYKDLQARLYKHRNTIVCESPQQDRWGKAVGIDNQGTLLVSDNHNVYFSFLSDSSSSSPHPAMDNILKIARIERKLKSPQHTPPKLALTPRERFRSQSVALRGRTKKQSPSSSSSSSRSKSSHDTRERRHHRRNTTLSIFKKFRRSKEK